MGARIIMLGETHYVQEHQEFLVRLLPHFRAAGVRRVLQEAMHGAAWAGEEYAQLRSDVLPSEVAAFDRTLLDGLRAFNAGLPEGERIHFGGFDVNHWVGLFPTYLRIFQDRFGAVAALAPLLAATPDGADYAVALGALPAALAADAEALRASLGADRYAQLLELVEVEVRSLPFRRSRDDAAREAVIRDRILAAAGVAGVAPVVVNTGMFHAQRERQLPPPHEPVGVWLATHPEAWGGGPTALRTIAFLAARGALPSHFYDASATAFDVRSTADNDLARILAELAGDRAAFLLLHDPIFDGAPLEVWAAGAKELVQPGRMFDAMVQYPTATVLESLAPYRGR